MEVPINISVARPIKITTFALTILIWICNSAPAQSTQPAGGSESAEQMLNDMLHPQSAADTPTTHAAGQAASMQPQGQMHAAAAPHILREGTDVVDRAGFLRKRGESLFQEFVFENSESQPPLAPMLVLPDLKLMSMEDATAATKPKQRFTVSGTATEYKGSNYILLKSGPQITDQHFAAPSQSHFPATKPSSADDLLSDMLKTGGGAAARPQPTRMPLPTADLSTGPGAVAPAAPLANVLREQSEVIDRTVRLSRSSDGRQFELSFEADGTAMQDPPLIILPNLKLQAMEGAAAGNSREPRFRVTGTITEYRGRNYILLAKVVVLPEINQQF
jgi:hypothetical protein